MRRYLQQSSGFFLKAAAGALADESSPLDVFASPTVAASARTYVELEARLFSSPTIKGGRGDGDFHNLVGARVQHALLAEIGPRDVKES